MPITIESVSGTNQYKAMGVMLLAQWNNGSLGWGSVARLTDFDSNALFPLRNALIWERMRDRERERQRQRETHRERHRERETERERDRETERDRDRDREGERDVHFGQSLGSFFLFRDWQKKSIVSSNSWVDKKIKLTITLKGISKR